MKCEIIYQLGNLVDRFILILVSSFYFFNLDAVLICLERLLGLGENHLGP